MVYPMTHYVSNDPARVMINWDSPISCSDILMSESPDLEGNLPGYLGNYQDDAKQNVYPPGMSLALKMVKKK